METTRTPLRTLKDNKQGRKPNIYYRTMFCKTFKATGECPYNEKCSYAHTEADLRKSHDPLPEEYLKNFENTEVPDIAPKRERREVNKYYKTQMCRFIKESQECPYGQKCTFAHSSAEIVRRDDNRDSEMLEEDEYYYSFNIPADLTESQMERGRYIVSQINADHKMQSIDYAGGQTTMGLSSVSPPSCHQMPVNPDLPMRHNTSVQGRIEVICPTVNQQDCYDALFYANEAFKNEEYLKANNIMSFLVQSGWIQFLNC